MNDSPTFRVGIVGAGLIARDHLLSLSRLSEVAAISIFDAQTERAQILATEFGAQTSHSLDALAASCDILWICTPPFARSEPILAACRAGVAVFCEKPLALSTSELSLLESEVQKGGIAFFMGQSNRFLAVFQKLKELVDNGAIGKPTTIWSNRFGWLDPSTAPPWRLDNEKGGGVIVELGVHEIDFIRWIGGDWQSVYARGTSEIIAPGRFLESVSAVGSLQSGVPVRLAINWASPRYLWQRGVEGAEGGLFFDDACIRQVALHRAGREPEIYPVGGWQDESTKENLSLREQAKAVLNSLRHMSAPPVTLRDGKAAVEVALAIRESARTGELVQIGECS